MIKQSNKSLLKRYGQLYRRVTGFDLSLCAYCNFPREALDHVPALSLVDGIDIKKYLKNGGKFLLYPACKQCNNYLSNRPYVGYLERLDYLEEKYLKKMNKTEVWSKTEIDQMTGMLKAYIEAHQYKIEITIQKVRNIDDNRLKYIDQDFE